MGITDMKWEYTEDKRGIIFDDGELYWKSQDNSFREDDGPAHISRNKMVIDELLKHGNFKSACDIGCRLGVALSLFEDVGIEALGIDISPRNIEHGLSLGRNVIIGDAHKLSSVVDRKFDAILSVHSLEHCHNPKKVFDECYKVLNDNGCIAIRLPIQSDLTIQKNKEGIHGKLPPHFSVFTFELLECLLLDSSFNIVYKEDLGKEIIMIGRKL